MNSRDIANLTLKGDCHQMPQSTLCCLFCPLSLIYWSCSLRALSCYNKASISSLKSNCDVSEYVLLLLGYGDQYGIKIYTFKWDSQSFSEWRFSNKDCRVFNQKVIHRFNPVIIPSSSFRNVLVIKMSTWKTNNLKVLSYWMFTNYISKLHLSIINSIYCIVINGWGDSRRKILTFFPINKETSMCIYYLP